MPHATFADPHGQLLGQVHTAVKARIAGLAALQRYADWYNHLDDDGRQAIRPADVEAAWLAPITAHPLPDSKADRQTASNALTQARLGLGRPPDLVVPEHAGIFAPNAHSLVCKFSHLITNAWRKMFHRPAHTQNPWNEAGALRGFMELAGELLNSPLVSWLNAEVGQEYAQATGECSPAGSSMRPPAPGAEGPEPVAQGTPSTSTPTGNKGGKRNPPLPRDEAVKRIQACLEGHRQKGTPRDQVTVKSVYQETGVSTGQISQLKLVKAFKMEGGAQKPTEPRNIPLRDDILAARPDYAAPCPSDDMERAEEETDEGMWQRVLALEHLPEKRASLAALPLHERQLIIDSYRDHLRECSRHR